MTRLKTEWIDHMVDGMTAYNDELKRKTGSNLREMVQELYTVSDEAYEAAVEKTLTACVPVTQGEGIIGSFSDSVCSIVRSMGFNAYSEKNTDVNGIYNAREKGSNLIFMADDIRYLAFDTERGGVGENNYSTALGFIWALRALMKKEGYDIGKEKILMIGYGIVGHEALQILKNHNCDVTVYDKQLEVLAELDVPVLKDEKEIRDCRFILDFTNEGPWLSAEMLHPEALYASPGVPLSLDDTALKLLGDHAVYDQLEIGTAVMVGEALFR